MAWDSKSKNRRTTTIKGILQHQSPADKFIQRARVRGFILSKRDEASVFLNGTPVGQIVYFPESCTIQHNPNERGQYISQPDLLDGLGQLLPYHEAIVKQEFIKATERKDDTKVQEVQTTPQEVLPTKVEPSRRTVAGTNNVVKIRVGGAS